MNIPLNIDWRQILLHLMNFAILAGGLYLLLYNPVKKFMDSRLVYYKELDENANKSLESAKEMENKYNAMLDGARDEIIALKADAFNKAEETINQQLEAAKQEGKKLIEKAKKAADEERNKIISDAQKEILQMAVDATDKLIAQTSSDTLDEFLNSVEGD